MSCSFAGRRSEQGGEWPEWRQGDVFVIDEVRLRQRQTRHDRVRVFHSGRWKDEDDALTVAPLKPLPNLAIKVKANCGAHLRREDFSEVFARHSFLERHEYENVGRLRRRGRLRVKRVNGHQHDQTRQDNRGKTLQCFHI